MAVVSEPQFTACTTIFFILTRRYVLKEHISVPLYLSINIQMLNIINIHTKNMYNKNNQKYSPTQF